MGDVLWNLEYALQLQETAMMANEVPVAEEVPRRNNIVDIPGRLPEQEVWDDTSMLVLPERARFSSISMSRSQDMSADLIDSDSALFSQIVKPQGR